MNKLGVKDAIYEGITVGDKGLLRAGFQDEICRRWRGLLRWPAYGSRSLMRQMADQGLKAPLMSGDGITSNELASIAGDASTAR